MMHSRRHRHSNLHNGTGTGMALVVISISPPDKDNNARQWFKAVQAGKLSFVFVLAFPGLEPLPGYALFGAYAVKWIGLFNQHPLLGAA